MLGRITRMPVSRSMNSAFLGSSCSMVAAGVDGVLQEHAIFDADIAEARAVENGVHPHRLDRFGGLPLLDEPGVLDVEDPLRVARAVPALDFPNTRIGHDELEHGLYPRGPVDGERFFSGGGTVLVEDATVITAEAGYQDLPEHVVTVDFGDATLLPGLIDTHSHLVGDSDDGALDRVAGYSPAQLRRVVDESLGHQLWVNDLGPGGCYRCGLVVEAPDYETHASS